VSARAGTSFSVRRRSLREVEERDADVLAKPRWRARSYNATRPPMLLPRGLVSRRDGD